MTGSYVPPDDDAGSCVIPFRQRPGREPCWQKKQLAEWLGVSERTIERWTAGGMPCWRIHRTVRYRASEVETWIGARP
jgi:excisionase family DNA binding protein